VRFPWNKKQMTEPRELTPQEKRKATMEQRYGVNWAHDMGVKTAETNKRLYGKNYFEQTGRKGGKVRTRKGFALMDHDKLVEISRRGGSTSRRRNPYEQLDPEGARLHPVPQNEIDANLTRRAKQVERSPWPSRKMFICCGRCGERMTKGKSLMDHWKEVHGLEEER
jgi:general stress protein YciG